MTFQENHIWTSLVSILAIIVYSGTTVNVGRMRMKCKIMPPAITGNPDFERAFRVQQNTLESLVMFLPALWLFSIYVNALWASIIGAIWIIGRILFAIGYSIEAEKRRLGFAISLIASVTLISGSLIAITKNLF